MNRKAGNKRPRPSYEDGKLRDPSIAKKQTADYKRGDLDTILRRAVTRRPPKH